MDVYFLMDYVDPLIVGVCMILEYCLKEAFDSFTNQYIPFASMCMGVCCAAAMHGCSGMDMEAVLGGMISGLASTGCYEMLRNLWKEERRG